MVGAQQPFIYEAVTNGDGRFPATTFDPKAVTRASYEPKPQKPKQNGPLVSINRHPDAHVVPGQRSWNFKPMSFRAKGWIKGMRRMQLGFRLLELIAAVGIFVLMILITNVDDLPGWVIRITLGVTALHCLYSIYHLSRPANGRTPGTSAAYHIFSGVSDLCVLPLYTYGVLTTRDHGLTEWMPRWSSNKKLMDYFVPAVYYGLITAVGLHTVSLAISLWLGVMFRRITMMPPDMNPLESNLTSRSHKRNKSSVAVSSYAGSEMRTGTPLEDRRRSGTPYEDVARAPKVPFMHTRQGSQPTSGTRDSRQDLPSRQNQLSPSSSPRNSVTPQELKRMSAPPRSSHRSSYMEIPLGETGETTSRPNSSYSRPTSSRPSSGTVASYRAEPIEAAQTVQPRAAKFSEAWYASESLVQRTQQRNRAMNHTKLVSQRRTYEALDQRYDMGESDSENENDYKLDATKGSDNENDASDLGAASVPGHPNPLRSNPTPTPRRPNTPFKGAQNSVLSDVDLNDRRINGSHDIADEKKSNSAATWQQRNRDSSIQPESAFFSKPYGDLKPGTPPIMVGSTRQVSSGNDYDLRAGVGSNAFGRRHVSGKAAEEGRAGQNRFSRYGVLNG
ncbi:hypothetical protein B0T26DRAFT_701451 [Lasiosphaeria miniovina]|uniref:Uncharacterized protein n=1 Tax=Lasiosphaeria miniovina TaxID=1954250 RepID=A0AA40E057_9PEZI|nr:uncharacterized protein B0T26DRAFT_701451 [Lasiosphaeria miniovina]KAK0722135.1 hypothetical protein B0T26DRAFT_701451 [Lasiosphaeria miniovina]